MATEGWPDLDESTHYTADSDRFQRLGQSIGKIGTVDRPAIESEYVRKHLGNILTRCVAEICEKRPHDPIEYMAQWIYKHRENLSRQKQELLDKIELQKEQEEKKREDELLEMGRPDAPEPNSLYKLNRSSLSSTTNSQVKIERRSSKNLNRQRSAPTNEVNGVKSSGSIKQQSNPNLIAPDVVVAPPTAPASNADIEDSNPSISGVSDVSLTNQTPNS